MKALSVHFLLTALYVPSLVATTLLVANTAFGQNTTTETAQWIWSPAHAKEKAPTGECFFRKTFKVGQVESARIEIAADDQYELFLNGRLVGAGEDWKQLDTHDITRYLVVGRNTIAVKVRNLEPGSAALVARVLVKQRGGTKIAYSTNATWKTSLKQVSHWTKSTLNDLNWVKAQSYGALGETLPWGNETQLAAQRGRFKIVPGFQVEWVLSPKATGSLIAMTFNEFGQIIAARENGPIILVTDTDKDGVHDSVTTYCTTVKNCQGLLALNGNTLAIGDGPDGVALYRLSDTTRDGVIDDVKTLLKFKTKSKEHGPHGLTLGPDGLVYIVVGNHATVDREFEKSSPLRVTYEGDLNQPRYEDPGGHAVGVKAPGGTIIRTDADGSFVELYAGGLRNPYDLTFNRQGDLFTYDADMESDLGLPWYRPTRINLLTPGARLGWRTGWAKSPEYFPDTLPAVLDMGGGSPTGVVTYNHFRYPVRFQNAIFSCDWALGRINLVRMQRSGGTYTARSDVFLEGQPLNVTDLAVGPDGWLYFCTGGRDTEGGIFCVTWKGRVPPEVTRLGTGIDRALRQPQHQSAWGRQEIAKVQRDLGAAWEKEVIAASRDLRRPIHERTRALDLMQIFGPFPPTSLLESLSHDENAEMRFKTAYFMGIHADQITEPRLVAMLEDNDAGVRRQACESLVRSDRPIDAADLIPLLDDEDRFVAYAARQALQSLPASEWKSAIMRDRRTGVFLRGSVGLMIAYPTRQSAEAIISRSIKMMRGEVNDPKQKNGFISDQDFTDMLRLLQLALLRGKLTAEDATELSDELALEYPSTDHVMNLELLRLLVYLQEPSTAEKITKQLKSDLPDEVKLNLAAHAPFLKTGWTTETKLELLRYFQQTRKIENTGSFARYIDNISRNFSGLLTLEESQEVLSEGEKWPGAALAVLAKLPSDPGEEAIQQIIDLDGRIADSEGQEEDVKRLRLGIVAVLGRNRGEKAMAHLREVFEQDPDRRQFVAIGLAQDPGGDNWPLLVRSLRIVEGQIARVVVNKLRSVKQLPENPRDIRQAILCGLRLKDKGATDVVALLQYWTGEGPHSPDDAWDTAISAWQDWFAENYPDLPAAELPVDPQNSKWTFAELLSHLESEDGSQGDPSLGAVVFHKGQCNKCHRYGPQGETVGPNLTTISRRFQKKEILQSIVFPSHVISDQYASKSVITSDGRVLTGIVAPAGEGQFFVLQADGKKVLLAKDDIDEISPSKKSSMPEGLLDKLTLDQVSDLFAYLKQEPRQNVTSRRTEKSR